MGKTTGRTPIPVRRMGTEVIADRRTRRLRDRGAEERAAVEESALAAEWFADGRVPGPWRTITVGPFPTAGEAGAAARDKHLGGIRVYCIHKEES